MTNQAPDAPPPEANAYAPPTAPLREPPVVHAPDTATSAQRIAGGLLIVNAVFLLVEVALPANGREPSVLSSPVALTISALIDGLIGTSLLYRSRKLLLWAIVRMGIGLFVMTAQAALKDPFLAGMQFVVCSSLLLLLVGDAGKPRMAVGGALFGIYAFLRVLGLSAELTGTNPMAVLIWQARGDIESTPAGVVTGEASHYRLRAPSDRWRLRKPEAARKTNPLADRWISRPDVDAHVLVVAEKVPGMLVLPDAMVDAVIKNGKSSATAFEFVDRVPLRTHPEDGRLVHTRSTTSGIEIESLTAVVATYERGYQVVAYAPKKVFAQVEPELRACVESFELPTDEKPGLPADAEALPPGKLTGVATNYTLTPPSEAWALRKREVTQKDNPLADRWIVRPDKDAHVFVVAEHAPGAVVDLEKYVDAVASSILERMHGTIESREPLRTDSKNARLLRVHAEAEGMKLEYFYGLFARGDRAFQVIAFARTEVFASVKDELLKAVETFEMPPENTAASTKR
ncbi:hypothetical protein [Polyangium mundeleinium]|uniref:Uncharacterized protein n=1 Tax=Polyangium mundeleinium TaxID=2995306 RepID=A0ABT5EWJ3_9BACT|nr:hypothetical protein [Polyangium mundeleinium]MDC0745180.1 hypothetical protein [Polyangium mundeleinium]